MENENRKLSKDRISKEIEGPVPGIEQKVVDFQIKTGRNPEYIILHESRKKEIHKRVISKLGYLDEFDLNWFTILGYRVIWATNIAEEVVIIT